MPSSPERPKGWVAPDRTDARLAEYLPPKGADPKDIAITALIRVYDTPPKLLNRQVMAALGQTFQSPVLIVDDGSRDPTTMDYLKWLIANRDRLAQYPGQLRYIRHTVNRGVTAAGNTGLKEARTPYVSIDDDDDFITPFYHATIANYIWLGKVQTGKWPSGVVGPVNIVQGGAVTMVSPTFRIAAIHRESALSMGGYNPEIKTMDDAELVLRMKEAGHQFGYLRAADPGKNTCLGIPCPDCGKPSEEPCGIHPTTGKPWCCVARAEKLMGISPQYYYNLWGGGATGRGPEDYKDKRPPPSEEEIALREKYGE